MRTLKITNDQVDIIRTALSVYKYMLSEESERRADMFEPSPEEEECVKISKLIMDINTQLKEQA